MELLIRNQQDKVPFSWEMEKIIDQAAAGVLNAEGVADDPEISVLLVDDLEIHQLNLTYRGIDRPTDVLSFAMDEAAKDEENFFVMEEESHILGDIVISLETAERQAEEYGHSMERELGFLTVHGLLHLLGYDHMTEADALVMRKKEDEILDAIGMTR